MIAKGCINWVIFFLCICLTSLSIYLITHNVMVYAISLISLAITVLLIIFFRDPERLIPGGKSIVSPADGKIIKIGVIGTFIRVSIFLNIYDVHVNRSPISGTVIQVKKISGNKYPAYKDYSKYNERVVTRLKTKIGIVNIIQITGIVARKIENYLYNGQIIEKGYRIGIMKFGSRCDVLFPKNNVVITSNIGDRVKAGSSIIGFIKKLYK